MELNILLIRTIFLLLPGIIGSKLYRKLRGNSQKKWWDDIGELLLFSLASYVLCSVLRLVDSSEFTAFFDEKVPLSPSAIGYASVAAIVLAFISALFHHRRWINRIAESTGISNRTGDEDIWDFFHNSELIQGPVFVRDHRRKVVYYGKVRAFSESGQDRELLLLDVDVYTDEDFVHLYCSRAIYLSRPKYALTIEAPVYQDQLKAQESKNGTS